ncbi:MAG: hypothetical protein CMF42_03900 [Legionellales bacterium]|nr:hypothetical protein [Legionellales bacterium]OUX67487.1 MAG: hypothetical protein CBD38_02280 [bacterium TMED178]|tara:strand:- start:7625 stop:7930 length:306 start_codon:yes stop_codon:yes gene_type:complete
MVYLKHITLIISILLCVGLSMWHPFSSQSSRADFYKVTILDQSKSFYLILKSNGITPKHKRSILYGPYSSLKETYDNMASISLIKGSYLSLKQLPMIGRIE